jgi:hypothetical protein
MHRYKEFAGYRETRESVMAVMAEMRKLGYVARANFMCCGGCAGSAISKDTAKNVLAGKKKLPAGGVFWHRQDEESFREHGELNIRYGRIECWDDEKCIWKSELPDSYIGHLLERKLKEKGLKVEWSGDVDETITVHAEQGKNPLPEKPMPKTSVVVKLVGEDGNAFSIMGRVSGAMRRAGVDKETIDAYLNEATSGDYDHLLQVTMQYVDVE